jgi:acetyl-CoA carboxylase carboxyltransferase component
VKRSKSEEARFYEVMKKAGRTAKREAIAEARGERTAREKVAAMLEQGYTVNELKRMVPSGIGKR